jgi:hypothetical protein
MQFAETKGEACVHALPQHAYRGFAKLRLRSRTASPDFVASYWSTCTRDMRRLRGALCCTACSKRERKQTPAVRHVYPRVGQQFSSWHSAMHAEQFKVSVATEKLYCVQHMESAYC